RRSHQLEWLRVRNSAATCGVPAPAVARTLRLVRALPSAFNRLAWSNLAAQSAEQVALAAAPMIAVFALGAGAGETGLLQTAQTLPFLVLSVPAGVLADRMSRPRLMAGAEAMRALALAGVLALAPLGLLALPPLARPSHRVLHDLRDGAAFVFGHPLLRPVFITQLVFNTAFFMLQAVYVPYAVHRLGLSPFGVGATLATYGVGMVAGALLAPPIIRALPFGVVVALGPVAGLAAAVVLVLTIW